MDNIFICALEKGAETIDEGITYNEMYQYITIEKRLLIPDNFEQQFRAWFFKSFNKYGMVTPYENEETLSYCDLIQIDSIADTPKERYQR
jgi:hypothetical protein